MPDPLISLLTAAAVAAGLFVLLRLYLFWQRSRQMTERVRQEDVLKHIHKFEMDGQQPTVQSVAGILSLGMDAAAELLDEMEQGGLLEIRDGKIHLSPAGRTTALHIIRAHRLWESYLAEETGYAAVQWHDQAERREHMLSPEEADTLAAHLGNPTHDPHGDPIPTADGKMVVHGGKPLCSLPVDSAARIVHLEDEPEVVYAQLVAEGLYPGMKVRLIESTSERVRFWAEGNEHVIAPIVAMNISAKPLVDEADEDQLTESQQLLSDLDPGETAKVESIARVCRGAERRRLLDLGFLPGTTVSAEMRSPGGEPMAYRVRSALIALRRQQAELIVITKANAELPVEATL